MAGKARRKFLLLLAGEDAVTAFGGAKDVPGQEMEQLVSKVEVSSPSHVRGVKENPRAESVADCACGTARRLKPKVKEFDAAHFFEHGSQAPGRAVAESKFALNFIGKPLGVGIAEARCVARDLGQLARTALFAPDLKVVILLAESEELRFCLARRRRIRLLSPEHDLPGEVAFSEEKGDGASIDPGQSLKLAQPRLPLGVLEL